ncbi:MAG: MFS transporter, partial [Acidimicrobiales bacterium]
GHYRIRWRARGGSGVRPFLRPLTLGIAVFHLGTAGAFSLLILVVTDVLEAPRIVFGIVLAAAAVGATIATLVAARLTDRFSRRIVITVAAALAAVTVIAVGGVTSEWQLIVVWALNGAAGGVLVSIGRGFIQRHTPNDRLGRTAIASRMITRTSFVLGALLAGVVATSTSVRWAFVVAGSLHLVGTAFLWRSFRHEPPVSDTSLIGRL